MMIPVQTTPRTLTDCGATWAQFCSAVDKRIAIEQWELQLDVPRRPERVHSVIFGVATARTIGSAGTTMTNEKPIADAGAHRPAQPIVHKIGMVDLRDALAKGLADFKAMPTHLVFLCLIYPIVTLIGVRTAAGYDVLPLVFPLLAGYTLIGPLVAIGMYELSRRREKGFDISRWHAFDVFRLPVIPDIATLGVVLTGIYVAWLFAAQTIYELYFGGAVPASIAEFARQIFTTPSGRALIIVGCGVGFLFAVVVFTLSVVSFPLLLDRDVGVMTAVTTSVRAVIANPITMAMWGFIVASTLVIGSLPFFVGLAIVLPVLGHSTWHLYRKVVES